MIAGMYVYYLDVIPFHYTGTQLGDIIRGFAVVGHVTDVVLVYAYFLLLFLFFIICFLLLVAADVVHLSLLLLFFICFIASVVVVVSC